MFNFFQRSLLGYETSVQEGRALSRTLFFLFRTYIFTTVLSLILLSTFYSSLYPSIITLLNRFLAKVSYGHWDSVWDYKMQALALEVQRAFWKVCWGTQKIALGTCFGILVVFYLRSFFFSPKTHQKGTKLLSLREYSWQYGSQAAFLLFHAPISRQSLCCHFLFLGATGTGKTVLILETLAQMKSLVLPQRPQFFCLDIDRSFETTLESACLIDLEQGVSWDFFADCLHDFHFETVAQALIPEGEHDHFWAQSARVLFVSLCQIVKKEAPEPTLKDLYELMCCTSLTVLKEKIRETPSRAFLGTEQDDKLLASILGTLNTYGSKLRYFVNGPISLSLTEALKSGQDYLFSINQSRLAAFKPILTVWFELLSDAILSGETSHEGQPKYVLVFDELMSLNPIPSLPVLAARGRKYGVSLLIGIQDMAQLKMTYRDSAESLVANLSTKFFLRQGSQKNALWACEVIGSEYKQTKQRSTSFSLSDFREGVSVTEQESRDFVMAPTELLVLPTRCAILRQLNFDPVKISF